MKLIQHIQGLGAALMVGLALTAVAPSARAQGVRTGYFSDSYLYRHRLNPAMANESAYFTVPVLPQFNVNLASNFGVKDFIFKQNDGTLTTFMNGDVSASDFLGGLKDNNKLLFDYDMTLFSLGFNAFGGYNTLEIGAHASMGLNLPKDLFAFMKEMKNDRYDISDIQAKGRAYANLDLGHSRQINEALRVGAKVKLLFGIAYADVQFDQLTADLQDDAWRMSLRGNAVVAGGGDFSTDKEGWVDGYDDFTVGLNGFGVGVDLGATYDMKELVDGLKLSAALTDLGCIRWKDCAKATANEHNTYTFEGFNSLKMHPSEDGTVRPAYTGTIDEQWDDIEDDLEHLTQLSDNGGRLSTETEALNATLAIGAEYELPVYKKVSFGALYTQRFGKLYDFVEGRINVNYAPSKAFDLSLSGCVGSYGAGWGALANLHLPGFSLFIGSDCIYSGSVNSDFVPLDDVNLNVTAGISFPLGW
jgi:hypothetical protein